MPALAFGFSWPADDLDQPIWLQSLTPHARAILSEHFAPEDQVVHCEAAIAVHLTLENSWILTLTEQAGCHDRPEQGRDPKTA